MTFVSPAGRSSVVAKGRLGASAPPAPARARQKQAPHATPAVPSIAPALAPSSAIPRRIFFRFKFIKICLCVHTWAALYPDCPCISKRVPGLLAPAPRPRPAHYARQPLPQSRSSERGENAQPGKMNTSSRACADSSSIPARLTPHFACVPGNTPDYLMPRPSFGPPNHSGRGRNLCPPQSTGKLRPPCAAGKTPDCTLPAYHRASPTPPPCRSTAHTNPPRCPPPCICAECSNHNPECRRMTK